MSFWNEVKCITSGGSNAIASTVGGATGENNVCKMWYEHYKNLLNLNQASTKRDSVLSSLQCIKGSESVKFDVLEVKDAIRKLKNGKSAGFDFLQAEHFKYADDSLCVLICMLFNVMLSHGYLPDGLMKTIIVPIIKDKKGLVTDKNNYRPIAITSIASKVLELILLCRMNDYLYTECNQFGFKPDHGTSMCVFTMKQIVEYYMNLGSPVYVCYLDASKAFDRINHWCLFSKLIERQVNIVYVRLFVYWYCNQTFCIRWASIYSQFFNVTNGVRQGGIMSPIFFNVYMNGLSQSLNDSKCGCNINGTFVNHLMYADDSCLIAPSPSGLQKLIKICELYADDNHIIYNEKKTKCMCFKPKSFKYLHIPAMYLNDKMVQFVQQQKYLGVHIISDLSDDDDILRQVKALYLRGNILVRHFKNCSPDVKDCLFKSYCSNIFGGELWSLYRKETLKKCVVAYNDIYRSLCGIVRGESMSQIYVTRKINSLNVIVRKTVFSFKRRLHNSTNVLIQSIISSAFYLTCSHLARKWDKLLYSFMANMA